VSKPVPIYRKLSTKKKHLHHSKACIPTRKFKAQKRKKALSPLAIKKRKKPKKRTSNKPLKHLILGGNGEENEN